MKLYEIPFTPAYSDVTRITSFNGISLNLPAKMIYLFMVGLQRNGQEVFPSINYLCELFGIGRSAAKAALSQLHESGLISSIQRYDNSKVYTVEIMPPELIKCHQQENQPEPVSEPETTITSDSNNVLPFPVIERDENPVIEVVEEIEPIIIRLSKPKPKPESKLNYLFVSDSEEDEEPFKMPAYEEL
ncbi:helix-turn-helix domain-containing protein [Escherichia coli]|uniref:Helix-turn-helix domain-containing protein n=1 Tax=Klebsiella pneumoniae TaxID=573 RepID=A0AAX2N6T5_KLEPN|nr:helix-turn-helix domain-containing protein [Klebsiella pneumoniae]EHK0711329.1 helix-turn-helix domain-containing protein [Escherichia coli]EMD7557194.1 helix-turn-helix domain-containing protein [Cronobacter sakazakii]EHK3804554.1 helix-turn-helix domain-containing protein [Escherichia coli]EHS6988225.1 helix-turn-helix domain-containing protein [Escherichia coli]EIK6955715.1 helix-turn-helix domain-containing protein [Escherichia coli]